MIFGSPIRISMGSLFKVGPRSSRYLSWTLAIAPEEHGLRMFLMLYLPACYEGLCYPRPFQMALCA